MCVVCVCVRACVRVWLFCVCVPYLCFLSGVGVDSESESDTAPSPLELGELPGLSSAPPPPSGTFSLGGSAARVMKPSLSSWNVTSITPTTHTLHFSSTGYAFHQLARV